MELLLQEFPKRSGLSYFTVKRSKGFVKVVKLGNEIIESKQLTIILDPFIEENKFLFEKSNSGGIILKQSSKGNLIIEISRRITLNALDREPQGDYLSSEFLHRGMDGKWTTKKLFVSLGDHKEE